MFFPGSYSHPTSKYGEIMNVLQDRLPSSCLLLRWTHVPLKRDHFKTGNESFEATINFQMLFFSGGGQYYIYLEPKWPLFWMERAFFFGGFKPQNRGQTGYRFMCIYIYAFICLPTIYGLSTFMWVALLWFCFIYCVYCFRWGLSWLSWYKLRRIPCLQS